FTFNGLYSKGYYTVFVLLFGLVTMLYLFPKLGDLKIPVVLYFMAILTMVLSALTLWNSHSYGKIVFHGALLFMVSDSLIAINKFQFAVPFAGFLIMSTYILAQWFIVDGIKNKVTG
ncbi:MAG: lysoplasmalogenase, partial [Bacteroidota bacterium]